MPTQNAIGQSTYACEIARLNKWPAWYVGGRYRAEVMAKILLVEDDKEFASVVIATLAVYDVDHVQDGREGLDWLKQCHYDAVILDWHLPSLDGDEVCRRYRKEGGKTPVLMLTGRDTKLDLVDGLDAGADDYLNKPFDHEVLLARLRALLRRSPELKSQNFVFGPFEVNNDKRIITVDGQRLRLTKREYAILELLVRANGNPISATALLERVWPSNSEVSPESVRCHIARIRGQIAKISKKTEESIQSIYGVGYLISL